MNLWKCQSIHCTREVVGLGRAIGLRAIGWYFRKGRAESLEPPTIYCSAHHPAPTVLTCRRESLCEVCQETARIQDWIKKHT